MRRLSAALALVALFASARPVFADDPSDEEVIGYSLNDEWQTWWRRILDRTGRPDPLGPIQQRFIKELYHEYGNDLVVGDFPLIMEREWEEKKRGARFWVHSLDALTLANQLQIKTETSMGGDWRVKMQFDRRYDRTTQSNLFQANFVWEPPGESGPFTVITVYPRWEKDDSDVEFSVGYHNPWGRARLRLVALDTFTNGSYALASHRSPPPEALMQQLSLPLALAVEASTKQIYGVRGELYAGRIIPQKTQIFFYDPDERNVQTISGTLGGMLVEWQAPTYPLWLGATGLFIDNNWERMHPRKPDSDVHIDELTVQARGYALAVPRDDVRVESQIRFTARPQEATGPGAPDHGQDRKDDEWLMSIRGMWMISHIAGLSLSLWRLRRYTAGAPQVNLEGTGTRFGTKCILHLGRLWATFGVGWDLDPHRSIYGGGTGTLIIDLD